LIKASPRNWADKNVWKNNKNNNNSEKETQNSNTSPEFNIVRFQRPELIPDIEKFLPFSIFKMATTIPQKINIVFQCRESIRDIIIYPHIKYWWYRTMLNFCGIVAAILKMATGKNVSMSEINSGHHYLPTYTILMISDNVEFLPPIFYVVFWQPFLKWQTSRKFWKHRIAPLMVTYHYVKFYVSIIIYLEVININVRNFNHSKYMLKIIVKKKHHFNLRLTVGSSKKLVWPITIKF
jgi:hypothetical protein